MTKSYDEWDPCVTGSTDIGNWKILECVVLQATAAGKQNYFQLFGYPVPFLALPGEISASLTIIILFSYYFSIIYFISTVPS